VRKLPSADGVTVLAASGIYQLLSVSSAASSSAAVCNPQCNDGVTARSMRATQMAAHRTWRRCALCEWLFCLTGARWRSANGCSESPRGLPHQVLQRRCL